MSLIIEKSPLFHTDVTSQFGWYVDRAGEDTAWRFYRTVDMTILKISQLPDLGRVRHFRNPGYRGLRSFRVDAPFERFLIFYRFAENTLSVWRLMDGSRDLPRRLA